MRNTHQRHGFYFMSKPLGGTAPFGKFSDLQVVVHPGAQQLNMNSSSSATRVRALKATDIILLGVRSKVNRYNILG